jgi:hypothetical protein
MATHYDGDYQYSGSSLDRGDHLENFDADGHVIGTTYPMADGYGRQTFDSEGRLEETEYETGNGCVIYDANNVYRGFEVDYGTHRDRYDEEGGYEGSSWD